MVRRIMTTVVLGLAVASQAAFAQDVRTPAPGPDRNVERTHVTDDERRSAQQQLDSYWATHDNNAPAYPFNP
jgi:hypothetical protein